MSYGPSFPDLFRRAADMVDKILRGMKPGNIPVEQPTKFEFVINLTTAKVLGLTIPASFARRNQLVLLTTRHAIPTVFGWREFSVGY